jgi:hypothetical protein
MKILRIDFIIDIINRNNIRIGLGGGKPCNILPIQKEGKGIIKISIGIFVIFLTAKDVVEGNYGDIGIPPGTLELERDRTSIMNGMRYIIL